MNLHTGYNRLQLVILNCFGNKNRLFNFYFQVFNDWRAVLARIYAKFRQIIEQISRYRGFFTTTKTAKTKRTAKKQLGLDWQNNNFARASHFFDTFLSRPLHDYNVKVPNFTFCRGREHNTTIFLFFYWTLIQSFRIQLKKNLPTFDELSRME